MEYLMYACPPWFINTTFSLQKHVFTWYSEGKAPLVAFSWLKNSIFKHVDKSFRQKIVCTYMNYRLEGHFK